MFQDNTAFNRSLSNWDWSNIFNAANFLSGNSALSTVNYDATLVSIDSQAVTNNVSINFGSAQYTLGTTAETARTNLINDHTWTITDGGGV